MNYLLMNLYIKGGGMQNNIRKQRMWDRVIEIAVPLFLAALVGLVTWVDKIDDRQYENAQKFATKEELKEAIDDLRDEMDVRFKNSENNQRIIIDMIKEKNNGS